MSDLDFEKDLYVNYSLDVKFIRLIDSVLVPSWLEIRAEVDVDDDASEDQINRAFTKIRYWFEQVVSKCLVFSADNSDAIEMFFNDRGINRSGNMIMLTPDEPTDEHLAAIFQAKLNALAARTMEFGLIEIISDNTAGLSFTFVGDGETLLPTVPEWIGERYYFQKPWWSRDDASTLDIPPSEDTDISKAPPWAYSLDFLHNNAVQETVVIRPEFRPTIINGGKED